MHYRTILTLLAFAMLASANAHAVTLVNSGFDGPEVSDIGDVTRNPITIEPAGTWLLGGHDSNSDDWDISGGVLAANDNGSEGQGLLQYIQDNKATTGAATFCFDFRMVSPTQGGDYDLIAYVFGWNTGDNVPGVDFENGTVETGDSFSPDDSVNLITDPTGPEGRLVIANNGAAVVAGAADDGVFHTISVNVDFQSGYDFVGVLFYGENGGNGVLELDNVLFKLPDNAIPEPATAALALLGVGGLLMRRRHA